LQHVWLPAAHLLRQPSNNRTLHIQHRSNPEGRRARNHRILRAVATSLPHHLSNMGNSSSNMDNSHSTDNTNKAATRDLLRPHHPHMDNSSSRHLTAPHHTVQLLTALRLINRALGTLLRDLADMFVSHARNLWLRYILIEY